MQFNLEETLISLVVITFFSILINYIILNYKNSISLKLNLIDYPDNDRKIHKTQIPLIACIPTIIIFNIISISYVVLYDFDILKIILLSNFAYIVGFFDDVKNLSYSKKLFFLSIFLLLIFYFDKSLLIDRLYVETFELFFYLNEFESLFLTIMCVLLLINAINLADGINSLAILIITIWSIYILIFFEGKFNFILLGLLPIFLIKIVCIFKNKYFLGDSGSIFLGMLIALITINNYNESILMRNYISIENLFLLFMIPGIDMFRLFVQRILKKRHPFKGDNEHLHHYLIKKFSLFQSLIFYTLLILIPLIAGNFLKKDFFFITFFLILYFLVLIFLKMGRKGNKYP